MRSLFVILLFGVLTFLLYFPVLGNGFLTDDYASLYRLLIERRVPYLEAVRPLIDLSFYFNHLISGLHPISYYIFNLCVHAFTCYMVYRVALDLPFFSGRRQFAFALTAGLLFLFYPFHNEGVVWLSGRLSSMAALFGLMAIHFSLTKKWPWNFLLAALCWFVGLFAYESIIVLPAVIVLLEWVKFRDMRRGVRSVAAWAVAGMVWLGMRYALVGGVLPPYAKGGTAGDGVGVRFLKVVGRCFLPPEENSRLMMVVFAGVVLVIAVVHVLVWVRLRRGDVRLGRPFVVLGLGFLLTLLPAVVFGVSTRTSEGDRLLYFPSAVLCLLVAAVLMTLLPGRRWRLALCGAYLVAGTVLIEANNSRWVFASKTVGSALRIVRQSPRPVYLVNAPDEWEGAYIFRNSWAYALAVNGIDTNKVVVTHFLTRLEYLRVKGRIEPLMKTGPKDIEGHYPVSWFIYPSTRIDSATDALRVYYWDKYVWNKLILM
jgi:hypothetical protein